MSKAQDPLTLAFEPVSYEAWRAAVEAELRGAQFDDVLRRGTPEGISIGPLYAPGDGRPASDPGYPGAGPRLRGATALATSDGWRRAPRYDHPDPAAVADALRLELGRGTDAAWLVLDLGDGRGVVADSVAALDRALDGVDLSAIHLVLDAGGAALPAAALCTALLEQRGVARGVADIAFAADPLGQLAAEGALPGSAEDGLVQLGQLGQYCAAEMPRARAAVASAVPYHDAGGHAVDELAYALATAVAYLRALGDAGLTTADAARQVGLRLPVGRHVFAEIAKLRAARLLWAKLLAAAGVTDVAPHVHACGSRRTLTQRDPWVNMLRATTQTFAAICGGADVITTTAFDEALGQPEALGRRVARNTQIVLGEESRVGQVIDPGGGSWFIEALTDELARAAWARLQQIERAGGMLAVLRDGSARTALASRWDALAVDLGRRKRPITGVSEYANLDETLPSPATGHAPATLVALATRASDQRVARGGQLAELEPLRSAAPGELPARAVAAAAAGATLGELVQAVCRGEPASIDPLAAHRDAEPFEALRDAAEALPARPEVFLANLGPIPAHKARAGFAAACFAAGGIAARGPDGTGDADAEAAAAALGDAFAAGGARVACLCGSDELYAQLAAPVARALGERGAHVIYLAGKPGALEAELADAGVTRFLFLGCDLVAELSWLLTLLGAATTSGETR